MIDESARITTHYPEGKGPVTPWGSAQVKTVYGPGVVDFQTSSHGGLRVSGSALGRIPLAEREAAFLASTNPGWFEEDCDWKIVARNLPELFSERELSYL